MTTYKQFCPVARALDKIGDKWSLLIVRDLLYGSRRFTDLQDTLGRITPKRLSSQLRELESIGVVERDSKPGRREVWYRLTSDGDELRPVIEALMAWGLRHAMGLPLSGEVINPMSLMNWLAYSFNKRSVKLPHPTRWSVQFKPGDAWVLSFDGDEWSGRHGKQQNADVTITTRPETWAMLITARKNERDGISKAMQVEGTPEHVAEFQQVMSVRRDVT